MESMNPLAKVVVEVSGGVVQSVWSNSPDVDVQVIDHDNLEGEENPEEAEAELREGYEDCVCPLWG